MPLLIVGSIGIDTIHTEHGSAPDVLGGSASYASIAAGFFERVRLVGVVGGDFPKQYVDLYKKKNIDLVGLETISTGATFRWTGKYHPNFATRDTLEIHLNVFETFRPKIPVQYQKTPYVLLANIDPELQLMVLDQIEKPKFVAADTMDLWLNIKLDKVKEMLRRIDLIVMNDEEAEQFTGEKNIIKAGKKLLSCGPKFAAIKKGANGAALFSKEGIFQIPAYPLETVVDPTGAGDCFIGGLMGYLASTGKKSFNDLKKGVVYGTAMASYAVEDFSLRNLVKLKKAGVSKRFAEIRKMTGF